jgi:predicted TIM-barrel fold metal-dependent hydrolase
MVIDFHSHNFPASLAARAIEAMCGKLAAMNEQTGMAFRPFGDGTVATQMRDMDRAGVDMCVNCPVCTRPDNFDAIFSRALAVRAGAEGDEAARRIFQLGSIHPGDPLFAERVKSLEEAGIPGVKLHPNYQGVRLDDPGLVPFFSALRDAGIFVISHCGFDPGYLGAPSVAGPEQIAALLGRVPGLKFVAGHLGGEYGSPAHATDMLLQFENCWIDTAVMVCRRDDPEAQRVLREWPADRMVFGTDYFWRDEANIRAWVEELRPDPEEREKIFHENAEHLLGIG